AYRPCGIPPKRSRQRGLRAAWRCRVSHSGRACGRELLRTRRQVQAAPRRTAGCARKARRGRSCPPSPTPAGAPYWRRRTPRRAPRLQSRPLAFRTGRIWPALSVPMQPRTLLSPQSGRCAGCRRHGAKPARMRAQARLLSSPPEWQRGGQASCPRCIGIGEKQLLPVDLVIRDRLLPFGRNEPVDEGLAEVLLYIGMLFGIHENHAVLIEEPLVAGHQDVEIAAVLEREPGAAAGGGVPDGENLVVGERARLAGLAGEPFGAGGFGLPQACEHVGGGESAVHAPFTERARALAQVGGRARLALILDGDDG